jgi:molybdopterin converting factor small subunit
MDVSVPEIHVMIPAALRSLCGGAARSRNAGLSLRARDVRGLLAELARQHPQVHVRLCDERGEPRPHINVFVNNDHVRARAALDTPLAAGDVVTILPAVSGG